MTTRTPTNIRLVRRFHGYDLELYKGDMWYAPSAGRWAPKTPDQDVGREHGLFSYRALALHAILIMPDTEYAKAEALGNPSHPESPQ